MSNQNFLILTEADLGYLMAQRKNATYDNNYNCAVQEANKLARETGKAYVYKLEGISQTVNDVEFRETVAVEPDIDAEEEPAEVAETIVQPAVEIKKPVAKKKPKVVTKSKTKKK